MEHRSEKLKSCMKLFLRCNRKHYAYVEKRVSDLGLHRSGHHMVMAISKNCNLSQKELAKCMDISPAAVAVALKKLESQGFIEREIKADDNRINNISVTEKGAEILEKTKEIFNEIDSITFKGFSDSDIEAFMGYLTRISDNIQDAFEEGK